MAQNQQSVGAVGVNTGDDSGPARSDELVARIDLLDAENRQLRTRLRDTQVSDYRRAALGFAVVGLLSLGGAVVFLDLRPVLLALGGIGLFSAVLTYYLTPETFLAASTAERVYHAHALTGDSLVDDLGLQETYVYVPTPAGSPGGVSVKLFVPEAVEYEVPVSGGLDGAFVGIDSDHTRGLALYPTGGSLLRELLNVRTEPLSADAEALGEELGDALVDVFELVDRVSVEGDDHGGRLSVGLGESAYGPYDRFDHPVVSFLATGLARQLAVPVRAEVLPESDGRHEAVVTFTWSPSDGASTPEEPMSG